MRAGAVCARGVVAILVFMAGVIAVMLLGRFRKRVAYIL